MRKKLATRSQAVRYLERELHFQVTRNQAFGQNELRRAERRIRKKIQATAVQTSQASSTDDLCRVLIGRIYPCCAAAIRFRYWVGRFSVQFLNDGSLKAERNLCLPQRQQIDPKPSSKTEVTPETARNTHFSPLGRRTRPLPRPSTIHAQEPDAPVRSSVAAQLPQTQNHEF